MVCLKIRTIRIETIKYKKIVFTVIPIIVFFCFLLSPLLAQEQEPLTKKLFLLTKSAKIIKNESAVKIIDNNAIITFTIKLPKEYLSDKWCVILSPTLTDKDTRVMLDDVVVKGKLFYYRQKEDYKRYETYISSIVDKSAYDSIFLDKKSMEEDMTFRQGLYWGVIYREWEKQIEFEKWKSEQDGAQKFFIPDQINYSEKLKLQYQNRIESQTVQYLKLGIDTAGLYARYMSEYEKQAAKLPRFKVKNDINEKSIPKKYKDIFKSGRTLDDITEKIMKLIAENDSIRFSYRLNDMIENEKKMLRKDSIFYDLVPFPYNENAKTDSVVSTNEDFIYEYVCRYPVTDNSDSVKVSMTARIQAIDRSGYTLPPFDTLLYVIPISARPKPK